MAAHLFDLNAATTDLDPELRNIAADKGLSFDDKVRRACIALETRVRQAAGLEVHDFGKDLIDKAFGINGVFDSISPVKAENIGLHNLFLGAVLYYRNPIAHRSVGYSRDETIHILNFINHLLFLLQKASDARVRVRDYVGFHEGNVSKRRDFSLDIDGDTRDELVLLLSVGPVLVPDEPENRLLPVILKRTGNKEYTRIPCDIAGADNANHGPYDAQLEHITDKTRPDIVAVWSVGETQSGFYIFRFANDRYIRVEREITGFPEPYNSTPPSHFTSHHAYKHIQFIDYDGDGLTEVVQRLGFSHEHDWKQLSDKRQQTRSRVWKWDSHVSLLKCVLDIEIGPGWI